MLYRSSIYLVALAAALMLTSTAASAFDDAKYPDMKGQWNRIGSPNWQAVVGPPPLTPEYQEVYKANRADMANGGPGDVPSWYCLPQGMPMMMNIYDPMEIVITPEITYILISHVNDSYRRIYTDGRDWPAEDDYELTYAGYSIGKWVDEDGDGKFDVLEIETRLIKGPRTYDASGIPFHKDGQAVIKERIYLDKADKNVIVMTTSHRGRAPATGTISSGAPPPPYLKKRRPFPAREGRPVRQNKMFAALQGRGPPPCCRPSVRSASFIRRFADQVAQGFRGAAAQAAVARAAIEPRHQVFVGEAIAAENLHGLAGDAHRHLVAIDLWRPPRAADRETDRRWRRRDRAARGRLRSRGTCRRASSACPGIRRSAARRPCARARSAAPRRTRPRQARAKCSGLRQRCVLNADSSLLEPAFAEQEIFRRQFAILEPHLVQKFAAHGVEFAGEHEAGRALLDQHAADAVAPRPAVDAREHDEGAGLLGAAAQCLDALEAQRCARHRRRWWCSSRHRCRHAARSCRSRGCTRPCTPRAAGAA